LFYSRCVAYDLEGRAGVGSKWRGGANYDTIVL